MSLSRPVFPFDLPSWSEVKSLLKELKENCLNESLAEDEIAEKVQQIYDLSQSSTNDVYQTTISGSPQGKTKVKRRKWKIDQTYLWFGVLKFLKKATEEEVDQFLFKTLPGICDLAIESEKLVPPDLVFSEQQQCSSTVLSKRCVASILSCSFLCLYPERECSRWSKLNVINFTNFFKQLPMSSQNAKMRLILNYFKRVTEPGVDFKGSVTFNRQVIDKTLLPNIDQLLSSDADLCSMHIHTEGVIEDIGSDGIEVDFANRSIGGGALGRGRVQEEIRFCACPELIASMLFMETMQDNEAITISGYEQFSTHSGYASGLEYVGDYIDKAQVDDHGNIKRMLCAIDAIQFKHMKCRQYLESYMMRELNKALVGFCDQWQSESNTSSVSWSSSHGHNTSVDDEYFTAVSSPHEEGTGQRRLSSFVVTLLSDAVHQAVKHTVDKTKSEEHSKSEDTKDSDHSKSSSSNVSQSDSNIPEVSQSPVSSTHSSNCDKSHPSVTRTLSHPQNGSSDLLDVDYGDWLTNFRRRSSNLSDVSRRSSSSTKHSSEMSSDLEEIYESYLKNEKKKHGTIEEETSQPGISDFATKLVACLMQEGTTTAAQMLPGMQMFDALCPPEDIVKPCAMRPENEEDSPPTTADNVPVLSNTSDLDLNSILQNYAESLMDATFSAAYDEVSTLAFSPSSSPLPELPPEKMYEWYADQIVQQVFLHVSQELAGERPAPSASNLAQDHLSTAASSDSSSHSAQSSQSAHNASASSSISSSSSSEKKGALVLRQDSNVSKSDSHRQEVSVDGSENCVHKCASKQDSSSSGSSNSSVSRNEMNSPRPEGAAAVSETAALNRNANATTSRQASVPNDENVNPSLSCDTRASTPLPDQLTHSSSIPPNSENIIPSNFDIKLDYHEAAAIIVDHVFQTLPTHLETLTASQGNHTVNAKNSRSVSSARGSFRTVSDSVSSVSEGKDSLPSKTEDPPKEKISKAGLPNFGVLTKKLSREMLTNAFLNAETQRHIKSYERRSSEPCHLSVELSLQAYNSSRLLLKDDDKKRKISRTDDDLEKVRGEGLRRGSWSSFPTSRRRSSCGFKDPILSKFAEELMKTDTTVPPLLFMGAHTNTSTTGSRRSSLSGFKDATLANLENELLNTSFGQPSSPRHSIRSKGSRKGKVARSESSETEYWFPLPKKLGTECQEELNRSGYYHSVDEIEDFADMFANDILNQAVSIIYRDAYMDIEKHESSAPECVNNYAEELAESVIRQALENLKGMTEEDVSGLTTSRPKSNDSSGEQSEFTDALDVPFARIEGFADTLSGQLMKEAMDMLKKHARSKNCLMSRGLPIATGNWGCGAFGGDPQLKSMLQWIAASLVKAPELHYYTFNDGRLIQFDEIVAVIQSLGWTVGRLMMEIRGYCSMISAELDRSPDPDSYPSITLFEYLVSNIYM